MNTPMRKMSDAELGALGWKFVLRDPNGDVASVWADLGAPTSQELMKDLRRGYSVAALPPPPEGER